MCKMVKSHYNKSINDFKLEEEIGKGAFGVVFKARSLEDAEGNYVAIKRISKKNPNANSSKIKNEISIHLSLPKNPFIVQCYAAFDDTEYWYLVLELCENGSLQEYLKRRGSHRLTEEEAAKLICQVIQGVESLHNQCIIHRDLSLKNILLTNGYNDVKIADLGLAIKLSEHNGEANTSLGTPNFMSPQVLRKVSYGRKTDCWSIGCILYNLLYGKPPFNGKKFEDVKSSVLNSELDFPNYASREAMTLLSHMLKKNEKERIELKDALKYDFFRKCRISPEEYQNSYQKNEDSGLSSLSSSRSVNTRLTQKTFGTCNTVSNYSGSRKENRNKCIKTALADKYHYDKMYDVKRYKDQCDYSVSDVQRPNHSSSKLTYRQNPGFVNQMKTKVQVLPSHNIASSFQDNVQTNSLYSNGQYSTHDNICTHKSKCSCQLKRCDSCHFDENNMRDNEHCLRTGSSAAEKSLRDITTPLNTVRLGYLRKELESKSAVFYILNDGQVCLEYWKLKKRKKYVSHAYFISNDGSKITVYKPKKKILLDSDEVVALPHQDQEVQHFTFENLPNTHWSKYQIVKRVVDAVRRNTPKVIIYGKKASCTMMENFPDPNFQMHYYNGFQITQNGHKKIIKDGNGCILKHDDSVLYMLEEFKHMKSRCLLLEQYIETYQDSTFPVTLGKKPNVNRKNGIQDVNKENVTPSHTLLSSTNGAITFENSHNFTIDKEGSSYKNSFQRSISTPQLTEKNRSTSKNTSNSPPQLKNMREKSHDVILEGSPYKNSFQRCISTPQLSEKSKTTPKSTSNSLPQYKDLKVIDEWVIATYSDGIQMYLSRQDDRVLFYDSHTKERISCQYPQLMNRFHNDSQQIWRRALLKETKRKM